MAKLSKIVRNNQRLEMIIKFAAKRKKLKKEGNYLALDRLPKNACPVRYSRRCEISRRTRGYLR